MKWWAFIGILILFGCMRIEEKFTYLPFGEVKPAGWIKDQLNRDLSGFTGHLDELVPSLIAGDDIYGKNRLSKNIKSKSVGNISEDADWEVQYLWWNSETQSNWRDGQIRQAILTGDSGQLKKVEEYVNTILGTQDSNGYLGIYDQQLRYRFKGENGELWAKATLLRGLLAYAESGHDSEKILDAIERAVRDVMVHYPINHSNPFKAEKPFAGICHGLVFTDVLDRLHQLTGNTEYLDYAAFLYRNYSKNKLMEEDICLENIMNPKYRLKGHGVHTYEHLRSLVVAYYATDDKQLGRALKTYLKRIDSLTTPSGGPVGDEWISGRKADASNTGYEYCSIHELLDSWCMLLQKTGNAKFGDLAEKLFFNAAQGARHPTESSIAYLKTDNSWYMTGPLNDTVPAKNQTRYKYSPVHQDVAVCCVPNAGRIAPYYVRSMWMKDGDGLVATLYGPSVVETLLGDQLVKIEEQTNYPYGYTIRFKITLEHPQKFSLKLRKPSWPGQFSVNLPHRSRKGFYEIRRTWTDGDEVLITFSPDISIQKDLKKHFFFTYGPLVLATPVKGYNVVTREYPLPGYRDLHVKPVKKVEYQWLSVTKARLVDSVNLTFQAELYNPERKEAETVSLVPMGGTILRQVTFK